MNLTLSQSCHSSLSQGKCHILCTQFTLLKWCLQTNERAPGFAHPLGPHQCHPTPGPCTLIDLFIYLSVCVLTCVILNKPIKSLLVPNTVQTRTLFQSWSLQEPHVICLPAPTSGERQYCRHHPGRWFDSAQVVSCVFNHWWERNVLFCWHSFKLDTFLSVLAFTCPWGIGYIATKELLNHMYWLISIYASSLTSCHETDKYALVECTDKCNDFFFSLSSHGCHLWECIVPWRWRESFSGSCDSLCGIVSLATVFTDNWVITWKR